MFVNTGTGGGLLGLGLLDLVLDSGASRRAAGDLGFGDGLAHQLGAVVNRRLGAGFVDPLAGEAAFIDLRIGGDDD